MIEPNNVKEKTLPSFKKYSRKSCDKAKCLFYSKLSCENDLYPNNNNKAKKLYKSTGYCELYQTKHESEFRKVILGNFKAEKERFVKRLNTEISKIEQIPQIEFNHNVASFLFNPTDLSILISLENNLEKHYRPIKEEDENEEEDESQTPIAEVLEDHQLLVAKDLVEDIDSRYTTLEEILLEISNRGFGGKPYRKKTTEFIVERRKTLQEYINFIRFLKKYRRKLYLRHKLLCKLFTGVENSLELEKEKLTLKDYFYFRDNHNSHRNFLHRNTARKKDADDWKDYYLCPSRNLYYEDDPHSFFRSYYYYSNFYPPYNSKQVEPIPIFKLLRKHRQHFEIQNIYTQEVVKLMLSPYHKIHSIHFPAEINPDRPQKPSRIDYFFSPQSGGKK